MKKITFTLVSLLLLFSSCKDKYDHSENIIVHLIGIYAETLNVLSGEQFYLHSGDKYKVNRLTTEAIDATDFIMAIGIGEKLDDEYIKEVESNSIVYPGIYESEGEKLFSYATISNFLRKETSRSFHISTSLYDDLEEDVSNFYFSTRTYIHRMELCITGVQDFVITADKTIFGVQPGENLAYYFTLESYYPDQVINYQTQQLLLGMSSEEKLTSISQWLSLHPMAFQGLELKFKTIPTELPLDVTFTVALLRDDDVWIKGTTSAKIK